MAMLEEALMLPSEETPSVLTPPPPAPKPAPLTTGATISAPREWPGLPLSERGPVGQFHDRVSAGVTRGVLGSLAALFSIPDWLEEVSGVETGAGYAGERMQDLVRTVQDTLPHAKDTERRWYEKGAEALGGLLAFYVPGRTVSQGTQLIWKQSGRLARLFGTAGHVILNSGSMAGTTFQQLKPLLGEEEAAKRANTAFVVSAAVNGVTDKLGLFAGRGGPVQRFVTSALANGVQNGAEYDIQLRQFYVPANHPKAQALLLDGWQAQGDSVVFPLDLKDRAEAAFLGTLTGAAISLAGGPTTSDTTPDLLGERGGGRGKRPVANLPKPTVTVSLHYVDGHRTAETVMDPSTKRYKRVEAILPYVVRYTFNGKSIQSESYASQGDALQRIADMQTDFTVNPEHGFALQDLPTPLVGRESMKYQRAFGLLDQLQRLLRDETGAVGGGGRRRKKGEHDWSILPPNPHRNPENPPDLLDAYGQKVPPRSDESMIPLDHPDHPPLTAAPKPKTPEAKAVREHAAGVVAGMHLLKTPMTQAEFDAGFPLIRQLRQHERADIRAEAERDWQKIQQTYGKQMWRLQHLHDLWEKHQGEMHKAWYRDALEVGRLLFGEQGGEAFIAYIASLSPRQQVAWNLQGALGAQLGHHLELPTESKNWRKLVAPAFFNEGTHSHNLARSTRGVDLSGIKVENFRYNNLKFPDYVTIDMWMVRLFGYAKAKKIIPYGDGTAWTGRQLNQWKRTHDGRDPGPEDFFDKQGAPTQGQYRTMAQWVRVLAQHYGVDPDEMQAGLWAGMKLWEGPQSGESWDDVYNAVKSQGWQILNQVNEILKNPNDFRAQMLRDLWHLHPDQSRVEKGDFEPGKRTVDFDAEDKAKWQQRLDKLPLPEKKKPPQDDMPDSLEGGIRLLVVTTIAGALAGAGIGEASLEESQAAVNNALVEIGVPAEVSQAMANDLPRLWEGIWPTHAEAFRQEARATGAGAPAESSAPPLDIYDTDVAQLTWENVQEKKRDLLSRQKALLGQPTPGEYHTNPEAEAVEPDPLTWPGSWFPVVDHPGEVGATLGEVGGHIASRFTGPLQGATLPLFGAAGAGLGYSVERFVRGEPFDAAGAKREAVLSYLPEAAETLLRSGGRNFARSLSGGRELRQGAAAQIARQAAQHVFNPPGKAQYVKLIEVLDHHHVGGQLLEGRAFLETLHSSEVRRLLQDTDKLMPRGVDALARGEWLSVREMQQLRDSLGEQALQTHASGRTGAARRAELLRQMQAAIDADQMSVLDSLGLRGPALAAREAMERSRAAERLHQLLTTNPVTKAIRGGDGYVFDLDKFINLYYHQRPASAVVQLKNDLARIPGAQEAFEGQLDQLRRMLPKGQLTITDTGSLWKVGPLPTIDKFLSSILTSPVGQRLFREAVIHGRGTLSLNTLATIINLHARREAETGGRDPRALALPRGLLMHPNTPAVTLPR